MPIAVAQPDATESEPLPTPLSLPNPDQIRRALHIDGDCLQLSLFKRLFERRGYRVSACTESQEALNALRTDPAAFDLVLTDYNMPGLSGVEIAYEVRAIRGDLAVAVLSGFIDETFHAQATAACVRALISKADPIETLYPLGQRLTQPERTEC